MSEETTPLTNSTPENINTNKINSALSIDELNEFLISLKTITAPDGYVYTAEDQVDKIKRVQNGELDINHITRTYGIRDKVIALLDTTERNTVSDKNYVIETTAPNLETAEKKIKSAKDFKELITTIIELGEIKGSTDTYSASEIVNEINELLTARAELQAKGMSLDYQNNILMTRFTRSLGLRDKIIELLDQAA